MKIQTLNDLALTVDSARHDLGRLKDALPSPRGTAGEPVLNDGLDEHIDGLRDLVDLDRLRALVETLGA
jgi:hypothetical protein